MPLTLSAEEYYIDKHEGTEIDVSHDFRRAGFGNELIIVKGTALDIAISFTDDPGPVANTAVHLQRFGLLEA